MFIESLPMICSIVALVLLLFIGIRGAYLFSYYQKIGVLSLYYLYAGLFGVVLSALQLSIIFVKIIDLPPQLQFFNLVLTIISGITFIGFMYLLWKRPYRIGFLRISLFIGLFSFIMTMVPLLEIQKAADAISSGEASTFNIWHLQIAIFAFSLLLAVVYYYWKIMHLKNGLSLVVIFSLIPFLCSSLIVSFAQFGGCIMASNILYMLSFLPLAIKLTTEGFDHGHSSNTNINNINTWK